MELKLDTEQNAVLDRIIKTYSLLQQDVHERDNPELANPDLALEVTTNVIPLPVGLERLPPLHWQDVEARLNITLSRISSDTNRGNGSCNVSMDEPQDYYLGVIWGISSENLPNGKEMARDWARTCPARYDVGGDTGFNQDYNGYWKSRREVTIGSVFALDKKLNPDAYPDPLQTGMPSLTDMRNGEEFATMHRGHLCFVKGTTELIVFDPQIGYTRTDSDYAMICAKRTVEKMMDDFQRAFRRDPSGTITRNMMKEVTRVSQLKNTKAMIEMAKSEEGMSVNLAELDKNSMMLGVQNGIINLTTGKPIMVTPDALVTKRSNFIYDPEADCPRFKKFISEVEPDQDKQKYLLISLAYFLTGSVKEQIWFFWMGVGANGKSVLIELIAWCLGDYAFKIPTEMLMRQNRSSSGASPDKMNLQGRRLIYCNETTEGQRIDDALVKDITGGDTITARELYKSHVTFDPTHKLVVSGNHAPIVSDDGEGFWRRVALFEFTQRFEGDKADKDLLPKLKAEASGILNLLLKAVQQWNKAGLTKTKALTDATNQYRNDQDLVADFLRTETSTGHTLTIKKSQLYCFYKRWAEDSGVRALSKHRFSRKITDKGYTTSTCNRYWEGMGSKHEVQ